MSYKIVPKIIDYTVLSLCLILIFFCWIRFYTQNVTLSIILAIITTICLVFFIYICQYKKQTKTDLSKQKKKFAEEFAFQISFCSQDFILQYFYKALKTKYPNIKQNNDYLILDDNTIFVPFFQKDCLQIPELKSLLINVLDKNKDIVICCKEKDVQINTLVGNILNRKIKVLDIYGTFMEKYLDYEIEIPKVIETEKPKLKFKQILKFAFSRERTKNYLLLGLLLIFYSLFVLYKIYYLISGSILLIFAIITRLTATENIKEKYHN